MNSWKEICAKCADGEIEPEFCEYYGEPNGCNSPTYQEHPPVNNAAAMREALITCRNIAAWIRSGNASVEAGLERIQTEIDKALSAPARNCDVGTAEEQKIRMADFCKDRKCVDCVFRDTLDCRFDWAQQPYDERKMAK